MHFKSRLLAAGLTCIVFTTSSDVQAGGTDFTFVAVNAQIGITKSADTPVEIKLVDKSGQPVAGATFTRIRLDMAPDGMAMHTAKANLVPTTAPGVYRLDADYSMTGRWQLSLAAKVPGESETITGKVLVTVAP